MQAARGWLAGAATLMTAANVVMTPIALAAALWSERQAATVQREVEAKLREFADYEDKMRHKQSLANTAVRRIEEKREAIFRVGRKLKEALKNSDPADQEAAYSIYLQARALSECLDSDVLSPEQVEELTDR